MENSGTRWCLVGSRYVWFCHSQKDPQMYSLQVFPVCSYLLILYLVWTGNRVILQGHPRPERNKPGSFIWGRSGMIGLRHEGKKPNLWSKPMSTCCKHWAWGMWWWGCTTGKNRRPRMQCFRSIMNYLHRSGGDSALFGCFSNCWSSSPPQSRRSTQQVVVCNGQNHVQVTLATAT